MPHVPYSIAPSASFWDKAASVILDAVAEGKIGRPDKGKSSGIKSGIGPLAGLKIVVPSFHHVALLKSAFAAVIDTPFAAPSILPLSALLAMQPPGHSGRPASDGERTLALYAELRQHPWLKKLFAVKRNTELLPLAQTLISLCDELTCAMLPDLQYAPDLADERWQAALAQLPTPVRNLLSEESQLVWSIWKSQLDRRDPLAARFARMQRLAADAVRPLVWIAGTEKNSLESAFLNAYAKRQPVLTIDIDWRHRAVDPLYAMAWPEVCEDDAVQPSLIESPNNLALCAARGLEDEAVSAAVTVLDWLASGCNAIGIVAQDRVVARRARALIERAGVLIADETGWKLSTTRAAAAVAAWFEVVTTRAETSALLDFLKSPFVLADLPDKAALVMTIELAVRRHNVIGGWNAAIGAVASDAETRASLITLAEQAGRFMERRTLAQWVDATYAMLDALGMRHALAEDDAGRQVLAVLDAVNHDDDSAQFTFSEWRSFICMQLEATTFALSGADRRVVMLPLAETRLRRFDAIIVVGADASHLPARGADQLFFANAVRRELGLSTHETQQRQQLRDLALILHTTPRVVLSWQAWRRGEPSAVSAWIERLQLVMQHAGIGSLSPHRPQLREVALAAVPTPAPAPSAAHLLPQKLSSSGFGRLVNCPYQFFTQHMLGLLTLNELNDLPEKRDYGDWLHDILNRYHETLRDNAVAVEERPATLAAISEEVFGPALERHGAALGYYARWQKAMPAYLEWAARHEKEGWRFVAGECRFEKQLDWQGGAVTLHGRVDRIDTHADGARAVLDYKTSELQKLKTRLKKGEDHQLAFYGILSDASFDAAFYVALEPSKAKTGDVQADDYMTMQQTLRNQIAECFKAIGDGAPLPANGIEATCQYCDVRGVCRKGSWS